jgi:hypothetical protein
MNAGKWMVCALAGVSLAACVSLMGVESLKPGTISIEQVRAKEKPAAEWKNTDGTLSLEYDARPDNAQNVMLDFDAKGMLTAVREVITLENMALLRTGMTRMEVKRILGNPRYVAKDGVTGGDIWEWPLEQGSDGFAIAVISVQLHPVADGVVRIEKTVRFR